MIKGIDVSSWDGWDGSCFTRSNTESCYYDSDFVIVKTTEGTNYVNPYADPVISRVQNDGKLMGFYHYANGKDATSEADYFYDNCVGYFGHGIPVLDWEGGSNRSWGSTDWAREWCNRVHERSGIWPMIYVQASAIWQVANCSDVCALWVAGYPDLRNSWDKPDFIYDVSPWQTYTVWQYTSGGNTDRNVGNLDANGWNAIATAGHIADTSHDTWIQNATGWWYRHADGSYTTNNFECIQGTWYYFDNSGYLKGGWVCHDNKYYYMHDKHDGNFGALKSGWQTIDGEKYHFSEIHDGSFGQMTVGWWTDPSNGKIYHFNENNDGTYGKMDHGKIVSYRYLTDDGTCAIETFSFIPGTGLIYSDKNGDIVRNSAISLSADNSGIITAK